MSKKFAVIYDRASTQKQEGNWSRKEAEGAGGRLAEKYGFDWELRIEIKSGKGLSNRPVMIQILEDIRAGKIHAIICQALDKLGRPEERYNADYIKSVCLNNDVLIITPDHVYNLDNDSDEILADTQFMIAKFERRNTARRITRAMAEKARQGGYNGGPTPLGYELVYSQPTNRGKKPVADLAINEQERSLVELIFSLYIELESSRGVATRLNSMKHRGKNGNMFTSKTILGTIENPIYAGFVAWGKEKKSRYLRDFERPFVFREELQIIPIDVWEHANRIKQKRSRKRKNPGEWGSHLFTGFVVCGNCGGNMVGSTYTPKNARVRVQYYCYNRKTYGEARCSKGKTYDQDLIAQAIIPFMARLINNQIGLDDVLSEAAEQYGKTVTEKELEEMIKAELLKTNKAKKRVVNSIAEGILTPNEARDTLTELREQEQRLNRELATIGQKAAIRTDYLQAIEALKHTDIEKTLWIMSKTQPKSFRKLLGLIFQPNSIRVRTEHVKSCTWAGYLEGYEFTEAFLEIMAKNAPLSDLPQTVDTALCNQRQTVAQTVGEVWDSGPEKLGEVW